MSKHSLRSALESGIPQLGLVVMYPAPGVIERIAPDWDCVWIDGQHGQLGYNDVLNLVRACDLVGKPALVRVSGHDFGEIGKALDTGAAGIIVPCVDTPDEARRAVDAAKFPPLGKRSYGGRRPIDFAGRTYSDTANADVLLITQIESPEAIANADAIAAIPGVDALFLGPDDLMLRRGFDMNHPRNEESLGNDMAKVSAACRAHGKHSVMVGVDPAMQELCLTMGFSVIVAGSDVGFLVAGSKKASGDARAVVSRFRDTDRKADAAPPKKTNSPY